jgi:hypothetical protein
MTSNALEFRWSTLAELNEELCPYPWSHNKEFNQYLSKDDDSLCTVPGFYTDPPPSAPLYIAPTIPPAAILAHGPFDFATINKRKSRDRINQLEWDILKSHCDLYHNPLPHFDVPTYSVHVDADAHTSFYCAAFASALSLSAQCNHHTPTS